jgi:hypothetical protein
LLQRLKTLESGTRCVGALDPARRGNRRVEKTSLHAQRKIAPSIKEMNPVTNSPYSPGRSFAVDRGTSSLVV